MIFYNKELRRIRKKKNISVNYLSEKLGITSKTYYRWESGESQPSQNDIRILSILLDTNEKIISDIEPLLKKTEIKFLIQRYLHSEILPARVQLILEKLNRIIIDKNKQIDHIADKLEFYRNCFNSHPFAFYYKDKHLNFVKTNMAFSNYFDFEQNCIGKKNINVFSNTDEAKQLDILEKNTLDSQSIENFPIELNQKNYFITLHRYSLLKNSNIAIIGIIFPADEYKTLEHRLDSFELMINNTEYIFWIKPLSKTYKYILLSKNTERIYGYPRERFYDEKDFFIKLIHPEDRKMMKDLFKSKKKRVSVKFRLKKTDNQYYWFESEYYYRHKENLIYGYTRAINS